MPDTVGDDQSEATEQLSGAGFTVRTTFVEVDSEDEDGIVQTQEPGGGDKADRGSTVTIGVGSFTPPADPGAGRARRPAPRGDGDAMRVVVLAGGRSSEHDVSLASGASVVDGLERAGHETAARGARPRRPLARWTETS